MEDPVFNPVSSTELSVLVVHLMFNMHVILKGVSSVEGMIRVVVLIRASLLLSVRGNQADTGRGRRWIDMNNTHIGVEPFQRFRFK